MIRINLLLGMNTKEYKTERLRYAKCEECKELYATPIDKLNELNKKYCGLCIPKDVTPQKTLRP